MTTAAATDWPTLLRLIPGYDPYRDAEGCTFDEGRARLALDFFPECLRHVEGDLAGKPFALEPWEQSFVANLFGWRRGGVRRYREALLYVPRKNGKTPLVAGIAALVFFCDPEAGQQNYVAAADREQAGMLFRHVKGMVEQEPELSRRCRAYGGNAAAGQSRSLVKHDDLSFLRVVSADAHTKHGGNPHLVVIDELHAQPDRELVDVLRTSMASANRAQPLTIYLTTADFLRESVCNEVYDRACKVRDGVVSDPAFLPAVYEAAPGDDWTAEATWRKANPNLGVSVSPDYLRRECERAKVTPAYENTFKRLHLNLRTQTDVRWLPAELWARGGGVLPDLAGRTCYAGIDFGWRDDYAALVLDFPDCPGPGQHAWRAWFWLPGESRRDRRKPPLDTFLAEKLVALTPGNSTDMGAIYDRLRACARDYELKQVAIDPANARKQAQDLMAESFDVVEFAQSKRNFNEACRSLESLLRDGGLCHGGDKVLAWMAANVAVEANGLGELMPRKVKSAEKIDGICAGLMAHALALRAAKEGQWYSPGILTG